MSNSPIPIQNIYYLLCYAWDQFAQGEMVDVPRIESTELVDLFAVVLTRGIERLVKRGFERTYSVREEELRGIRGKVDLFQAERRLLRRHGRAACSYDELTLNSLPNQIIKSTLRLLGRHTSIDKRNRTTVLRLAREFQGIDDIRITENTFHRIQLNSNSRFYRFLLNVCQLIHGSWLVNDKTGAYRFRDIVDDEKRMARVFQSFIYNFLKAERSDLVIERERSHWRAESDSKATLELLPVMETDVSIYKGDRHIILDTKFSRQTFGDRFGVFHPLAFRSQCELSILRNHGKSFTRIS